MKRTPRAPKACVAMSGGVDSSVAALLLVRAGYDVTGVFMRPWQPRGLPCLWREDRADALRVAASLGIPLETWDFSRAYGERVTKPMLRAYRSGSTPNPDVDCNRHIKFGLFYARARRRGAAFIATGHYARVVCRKGSCEVRRSADAGKDQTYFLWNLRSAQLPHILFPVGHLKKAEVRRLAKAARLHIASKKDSQGVCFVGPLDMKTFLVRAIPARRGSIRHADGRVIGEHDGAGYYTVGQRHGLDIKDGGGPHYVIGKNMRTNVITVGPERLLLTDHAHLSQVHWIGRRPRTGAHLRARIRHRGALIPVRISGTGLRFLRPARAVASGQSVVFYEGTRLAGGAVFR